MDYDPQIDVTFITDEDSEFTLPHLHVVPRSGEFVMDRKGNTYKVSRVLYRPYMHDYGSGPMPLKTIANVYVERHIRP